MGLAVGLTNPLEVFLVIERLGMEKEAVQYLAAADGIGMLIGGIVAAVFASKVNQKDVCIRYEHISDVIFSRRAIYIILDY